VAAVTWWRASCLGKQFGVVSGSGFAGRLLLTIAISIARRATRSSVSFDRICMRCECPSRFLSILFLTVINVRGVREAVIMLTPIFSLFSSRTFW